VDIDADYPQSKEIPKLSRSLGKGLYSLGVTIKYLQNIL
jgi:hypothetical protein